ncbi:diaminopropionate ammonia-lyase [Nakamurella antarctica]|uniref:Diaminopropionate ammonia-lyase n=1 Tax=Nakamurella antarctica TaxID=1902245 RepID=A0A3G8ZHZ4_9ACTN|nr:diaminopropionate ammonia-lyase [Nakamurella antarctica]AZI56903.1 diaminopropionate ammonia-lyase [Nakamurella antarctica]
MSQATHSSQVFHNPAAVPVVPLAGFSPESRRPMTTHQTLPGYEATPLHDCPSIASRLGVARVWVKDESSRMELPSFKILGASWATLESIRTHWLDPESETLDVAQLRSLLASRPGLGLAAATDGNHGRGVARMARLLGLTCKILVPEGTAAARISAIASEGAEVEVVAGTYDDAVAAAALLAGDNTLVVSDTSWPGYEATPRAVVDGYSTMFFEVDDELARQGEQDPNFIALQAGVGAFAAAGLRHYRSERGDAEFVRTAIVEPQSANCLMASAEAGAMTMVPGPHLSTMAGLNCGLPSELVWPIIAAGSDTFVGVSDDEASEAMRLFADIGIESGESGAASLAGLLALSRDPAAAAAAGLTGESRVLLINTEGATDPENYAAVLAAGTAS